MARKTFLRVGAYYQSETGKSLTSDLEITDIVDNTDPNDPVVDDEAIFPDQTGNSGKFLKTDGSVLSWGDAGGSVSIPATAYASNADAVAALGVGVIYKTTTVLADGVQPILSVTV